MYPPEFIFAEKLETILRFGTGNTRLKDFIDLYTLTKNPLNTQKLKTAVMMCFKCRGKIFQAEDLLNILNNKDYTSFLSKTLKTKTEYKRLNLPSMGNVLKNVKIKVEELQSLL